MSNTIVTNYQTSLVALRAAEVAPYFTLGSKAYVQPGELVNKRNGQTYGFVIRSRGEVENQLPVSAGAKKDIVEREVKLAIEPWHVYEKNDAVEGKTDLQFDKEVAEMDGPALIQGAVKKEIARDYKYCVVVTNASGSVTSKGAQFVPVDAPAMYKQGLIGHFHGADYRSQRFIPRVKISSAFATAMTGATFASFNATTNKLTVTFGTAAASAFKIGKGTPFFIDGIVACDTLGDETTQPYAFIASKDVTVSSSAETVEIDVDEVPVSDIGTRVAAMEDGSLVVWSGDDKTVDTSTPVSIPEAGTYFGAIIRANGAYNFQTLDEIDVATPESKKGNVQGITVFQNRLTDLDNFTTGTRFDTFTLAGTVEKRAQALVLVKAK